MAKKSSRYPSDFIMPLVMNRLHGRMLYLPPPPRKKSTQILIVYGQHSTLEHWWPLAQELNRYGGVTMPDLPGFGGMHNFYKLNEKPSVDKLSDYLASFVKLRYKRKRVIVVAIGFGFIVTTRMLQRYPDLARKVDVVINIGGFAHKDDLTLTPFKRFGYRYGARFLSLSLPAAIVRNIGLHPSLLRRIYVQRNKNLRVPLSESSLQEQVRLWRRNDIRTHLFTLSKMMAVDHGNKQVQVPLWHINFKTNKYFDDGNIGEHLRIIYPQVEEAASRVRSNSLGTVVYNPATTQLLPTKLRKWLSQNS